MMAISNIYMLHLQSFFYYLYLFWIRNGPNCIAHIIGYKIVDWIVEYNVFFLPKTAKAIAYDAGHVWDKDHYGLYHGASLAAFHKLGRSKGYALAYTEPYCPNAIFVRESELPESVVLPSLLDWTRWDWPPDQYVEPVAPPGRRWVEV